MATLDIVIPKLNPIQLLKDGTDQWFFDSIPYFEMSKKYCQKFQKADVLMFQYAVKDSEFLGVSCVIINPAGFTVATPTDTALVTKFQTGYTQHHLSQSFAGFNEGLYFVKLTITTKSATNLYYSEPIHIKTFWANTLKLEYTHDENDFNLIFRPDINNVYTFQIRVEGGLKSDGFQPTSTDKIYRNDRADMTTVHSTPFLIKKFTFGDSLGIPNWLAEKVFMVFSCYYSQINGIYYNKNENAKYEPNRSENYPLAGWTLELVEDEDMNNFEFFPFPSRIYYLFRGVVDDASTDPGVPTEDIYYAVKLNTKDTRTFTHFGGLTVDPGEMVYLRYDTVAEQWVKDLYGEITDIATDIEVASWSANLTKDRTTTLTIPGSITKTIRITQIYWQDYDGKLYPMPGIQMYYDTNDSKWKIDSTENVTVIINVIAYENPS